MARLVQPQGDAVSNRQRCDTAPTLIRDGTAIDTLRLQLDERPIDVVAHEIQLVRVVILGTMA